MPAVLAAGLSADLVPDEPGSLEVAEAIHKGRLDLAVLYAGTSVAGGLFAFAAATALVRPSE